MNLKTSFFNKTLFKSNLQRTWWVSAVYFIMYLTFGIYPLMVQESLSDMCAMTVLSFLAATVLPSILFQFLHNPAQVSFIHSLPVKRKGVYITNLITCYFLLLVPAIISYLIVAVYVKFTPSVKYSISAVQIVNMFLSYLIFITVGISAGVLGNAVTGNAIASVAFSGLFAGFPFYTETTIISILQFNVYGMMTKEAYFLTKLSLEKPTFAMLVLLVTAIVFLAVSWFLYKKRNLEVSGDIISYKFLKPVFISLVAFFIGAFGYFYVGLIANKFNVFCMIPFGLLGVIISNMLTKKAFTLKGFLKPGIIYSLLVVLAFFAFKYDVSGFERRVPDAKDVEYALITDRNLNPDEFVAYYGLNDEEYYYLNESNNEDFKFKTEEEIKKVTTAHKKFVERKENFSTNGYYMPIYYKLKNGRLMKRAYYFSPQEDKELVREIFETKQKKNEKFSYLKNDGNKLISVEVSDTRLKNNDGNFLFGSFGEGDERAEKILDAILKDVDNLSYESLLEDKDCITRVTVQYVRPLKYKNGKPVKIVPKDYSEFTDFTITKDYKNTVKVLKELGLYDNIYTVSDIEKVEISSKGAVKNTVTERETIEKLYKLASADIFEEYVKSDKEAYDISLSFLDGEGRELFNYMLFSNDGLLPETVAELVK